MHSFRYDFVLEATEEIGNYWFRTHGENQTISNSGLAVVNYRGAPRETPKNTEKTSGDSIIFQETVGFGSTADVLDVGDLVALGSYHN